MYLVGIDRQISDERVNELVARTGDLSCMSRHWCAWCVNAPKYGLQVLYAIFRHLMLAGNNLIISELYKKSAC